MSEEKSSPIGIIFIVVVAVIIGGCASDKSFGGNKQAKSKQPAKPDAPAKTRPEAPFFDPERGGHRDIEANIRERLNKPGGEITRKDLEKLKSLNIRSSQISDLSPLKGAINIEDLSIRGNPISDLSALAGMKNLKSLAAHDRRIADLSPLAGLTKLEGLWFHNNSIKDLSPLAGLTKLEQLHLIDNSIEDLSPLAGLKQLTALYLNGNSKLTRAEIDKLKKALPNCVIHHDLMNTAEHIEAHIRGVLNKPGGEITQEDLESIEHLNIRKRQINDLSALAGVKNLESLVAYRNRIADLSPLAGMKNLKGLNAGENRIADLSPLAGLTKLEGLWLNNNSIKDLSPLAGLKQLTALSLNGNPKLTRAEIDKLQKPLPNCKITHSAKE